MWRISSTTNKPVKDCVPGLRNEKSILLDLNFCTMRSIYFFVALLLPVLLLGQNTYQKRYDNGAEFAQSLAACPLNDGGTAMVGLLNIPGQSSQAFVSRLRCDGTIVWTRLLGSSSTVDNIFPSVKEDGQGNIWFTSNIGVWQNYDGLVGYFTPSGDLGKAVRVGTNGRNDQLYGLDIDVTGKVYVCGLTNSWGSDKFSNTAFQDVLVMCFDKDLNVLWSRTVGNQGNIDTGFDLKLDQDGMVHVTGRYIVNGTFFTYLLRIDPDGNILTFKGFGESSVPHRTYGYSLLPTADGHVLLTGSTTIDKTDHTSIPDVFLLKTTPEGAIVFNEIFIPVVGGDNSESGSSIVESPEGRYIIGVPTMSFTVWTQGFVPNKYAAFVTNQSGKLTAARIFNRGGSHYNKIYSDENGFLISGFSNQYSLPNPGAGPFQPLVIRADHNLISGCNEVDVSNELTQVQKSWEAIDVPYGLDDAFVVNPFTSATLFGFADVHTLCESFEEAFADLNLPAVVCAGEKFTLTADTAGNIISAQWDMGDGGTVPYIENEQYTYASPGTYTVTLQLNTLCSSFEFTTNIEVVGTNLKEEIQTICPGDTVIVNGLPIWTNDTIIVTTPGEQCDTVVHYIVQVLDITAPEAAFNLPDTICLGATFDVVSTFSGIVEQSIWVMGDGSVYESQTFEHAYQQPGIYSIVLTLSNQCFEKIYTNTIAVLDAAEVDFEYPLCPGDSVLVNGMWVTTAMEFTTFLPGENCDTIRTDRVTLIPIETTNLETEKLCQGDSLTIRDGWVVTESGVYRDTILIDNCYRVDIHTVEVELCDCGIQFPNVFTPNNDNNNDTFGPVISCNLNIVQYSLKIFNRWGQLVFESASPSDKWDGTRKNEHLPADVYSWVMDADYIFDDQTRSTSNRGDITLVR